MGHATIEENVLAISHQDGLKRFRLKKGGYCIESGFLSISVKTENIDPEDFPPVANICIVDHPLSRETQVGDFFECEGGMDNDDAGGASAFGYFAFHAEEIHVKWTVVEVRSHSTVFRLEARHDDVQYYDDRAQECQTSGVFALAETRRSDLWIPI